MALTSDNPPLSTPTLQRQIWTSSPSRLWGGTQNTHLDVVRQSWIAIRTLTATERHRKACLTEKLYWRSPRSQELFPFFPLDTNEMTFSQNHIRSSVTAGFSVMPLGVLSPVSHCQSWTMDKRNKNDLFASVEDSWEATWGNVFTWLLKLYCKPTFQQIMLVSWQPRAVKMNLT